MRTSPIDPVSSLSIIAPNSRSLANRDAPTAPMHLSSRLKSPMATGAVIVLAGSIIELKGTQKTASCEYLLALGAMVAELARAASYSPPLGCYRPLRAGDFPSGGIGYQPFRRALGDMKRHGYVTIIEGQSAWGDRIGTVTRIFVTPKLTDFLATHGITVADRGRHFQYRAAKDDTPPIQLRSSSKKDWPNVSRGKKMKVDMTDPTVVSYANQIKRLNEYLYNQTVIGPNGDKFDIALYRSFNLGDHDGHGYKKGGRIYDSYQSLPRKDREYITINGQSTVEVDISACFLTLVHYFLGRSFSNNIDPYAGPSAHRDIVKAWVNLTIGYGRYHSRWPSETIKKLEEEGHMAVRERYPIPPIKEEILNHIPIIGDWVQSEYTWADLFYIESLIMIDAVECLAFEHGISALPIHDGIRIACESASLAKKVLRDSFHRYTNIYPKIT